MIDRLWDFSDPAASEERFREAADDDDHPAHVRAVMATQLARALGIQGRVDEALDVLDAVVAAGIPSDEPERDAAEVRARVGIERGRILAAADRRAEAVPSSLAACARRHSPARRSSCSTPCTCSP